ncbi:Uncharacterised protein [Kluyvera cryocrescens]|uniref:Uncharacterized protein n=1 Tax=Kluyvera cryocrescens TaxID=580 RepID=A0A485APZ3_KLUCR|nr:Uncharacterised protein [Kluyvera cryocrescens]
MMTVLKGPAWAGINHAHHRGNVNFIRDNPRFTFQVEQLTAAANAVTGVLANGRIEVDINLLPGVDAITASCSSLSMTLASIFYLSSRLSIDLSPVKIVNHFTVTSLRMRFLKLGDWAANFCSLSLSSAIHPLAVARASIQVVKIHRTVGYLA